MENIVLQNNQKYIKFKGIGLLHVILLSTLHIIKYLITYQVGCIQQI